MRSTRRTQWQNWAGNQVAHPLSAHAPGSDEEVIRVVRDAITANMRVKIVGAGHSFTGIAVADEVLISLDNYDDVIEIDRDLRQVTVQAGIRLFNLIPQLAEAGLALPNLGDIAYQSVAGATSTSTHGTGLGFQSIAAGIVGLEIIAGDGSVIWADETTNSEILSVARVGLGALGVVTKVKLQCVPMFNLRAVEGTSNIDVELEGFFDSAAEIDHYEFFWFPHTDKALTKRNTRTVDEAAAQRPIARFWNEEVMENAVLGGLLQLGRAKPSLVAPLARQITKAVGSRTYVSASADVFTTPRRNRFYEMEYAIPFEHGVDAVHRIRRLIDQLSHPVSFPIEVRVLGADDIALSTASHRPSTYIAVHMVKGSSPDEYFRGVETIMQEYGGRPHWGKIHYQSAASLRELYPEWETFRRIRSQLDPQGCFRNAYLDRVLGPID